MLRERDAAVVVLGKVQYWARRRSERTVAVVLRRLTQELLEAQKRLTILGELRCFGMDTSGRRAGRPGGDATHGRRCQANSKRH